MEQRLVFFDLETGGPNPKRHPIVQLAAIATDAAGNAIEAFEAKVKFHPKTANGYSLRKNGYRSGVWAKEAREGNEVARDCASFLKRHATHPLTSAQGASYRVAQLVAHHAAFDGPFLAAWFERLGIYLPAYRLVLCTMQLAMWQAATGDFPPPANFQLATLCRHYGVPFHAAEAHDALGDVTATVRLFQKLVKRGRQGLATAA